VQAIDKVVSFTGTALSPAARVEAWRVLAGESPEFVQLALGEDLLLEEDELFGACDTVILRRLLDDGVFFAALQRPDPALRAPAGDRCELADASELVDVLDAGGKLGPFRRTLPSR
jgi:hypothetical protein